MNLAPTIDFGGRVICRVGWLAVHTRHLTSLHPLSRRHGCFLSVSGGESYAKTTKGTHQDFTGRKPLPTVEAVRTFFARKESSNDDSAYKDCCRLNTKKVSMDVGCEGVAIDHVFLEYSTVRV
jgi:hypothetical protein